MASTTSSASQTAPQTSSQSPSAAPKDPLPGIEHVVLLMLENRSFDQILGALQSKNTAIDGVFPPAGEAARTNAYQMGTEKHVYPQQPGAYRYVLTDPNHEFPAVRWQISNGAMDGFVQAYATLSEHPTPEEQQNLMAYFEVGTLPAIHALAQEFCICDRWFSSIPGPTWPNRLFALSGTSLGRVKMPEGPFNLNLHWYDQRTLFDALNERGVSWKVYTGDFPLSMILVNQTRAENAARYFTMKSFHDDAAAYSDAKPDSFPKFSFIEPSYIGRQPNDGHPPHDILGVDALVAEVYNALRANDALWQKTLLIVNFDEHGGFYDHVAPPPTVAPDHNSFEYDFDFKVLGCRVPALLISPLVKKGAVLGSGAKNRARDLDHTSLLKVLSQKWGLTGLGNRTMSDMTKTFGNTGAGDDVFGAPRATLPNVVSSIELDLVAKDSQANWTMPPPAADQGNGAQNALVGLAQFLETLNTDTPAQLVADRVRATLSNHTSAADVALDRAVDFIRFAKARSAEVVTPTAPVAGAAAAGKVGNG